ncbi:MAG: ribonuclease T2 [Pseudolabrys sp.]|nr:ribonuclease T2 [Pseudolabrys sp.]MBV9954987.1 ribonuclease T2 [Pseudolabrys sp.]
MLRLVVSRLAHAAAAALAISFILSVTLTTAPAQERSELRQAPGSEQNAQNRPGQFDFYVLALSWSPSFCESAQERDRARSNDQQCGERAYSFVVHGLWPQHERGYPGFCQVPAPRLNRDIVDKMLDLMPSPRLVFHEWDRHGTCSGLGQNEYFETVRKARAGVTIPERFQAIAQPLSVSPGEVVDAFLKANAGLTPEAMSIDCDSRRLREVRICLSKDLAFRPCAEVARRTCRRDQLIMPPVRGARAAELR